ncbi:transcription factor DIVARICATA [Ricinus communis]|uniref:DNA binding protein, putative n=1 Tax=Ricinus communis TaxID=3988 RepID=B9SWP9_RICCO|nr:transcription factor DIVARICATA [Ricinus communis]EEF31988.1 DNA binding protein, putative [Ricinus communis]|eukprot:XP_002530418.1 transcription factor DIVARICATA [Ricinus communis]
METLYPSLYYMSNSDWYSQSTEWTREENKQFERALAIYDEHEPDRWRKVAAMIPGKTVYDVIKQYRELEDDVSDIEAGKVPIPGYNCSSSFTLELVDNRNFDEYRKRPLATKSGDQERKKGVPWTEDEHRRFLLGLLKHGKGDWRNISRNFVVSKTPTQVASHAQKYFIRQQLSGVKDKRRPSIHDITTFNLTNANISEGNKPSSLDQSNTILSQQKSTSAMQKMLIDWKHSKNGSYMLLDQTHGNFIVSSPNEVASTGLKHQGQHLYAGSVHINPHNLVFHRHQILG